MKLWPVYLALQARHAYGDSHPDPMPWALAEREAWQIWHRLHGRGDASDGGTLFIGPGGPGEIRALRDEVPRPLFALTNHEPEQRALDQAFSSTVRVSTGDMHELPYPSRHFAHVYASNVLEHAIAPYVALLEIRRVLQDEGTAHLVLPSFAGPEGGRGPFHLHCLSAEVWLELLRKCGLSLTSYKEEVGGQVPDALYMHFRVAAVVPPRPHDLVLAEVRRARGEG